MIWGHTITTLSGPDAGVRPRADARPTMFGSVPRIWEKLKAALEAGIEAEPDERKRAATQEAIDARIAQGASRAGGGGGAR